MLEEDQMIRTNISEHIPGHITPVHHFLACHFRACHFIACHFSVISLSDHVTFHAASRLLVDRLCLERNTGRDSYMRS